jgi:hypothetical protein
MEQTLSSVQPEEKPMGGASKVFNIFLEPRRVFESLRAKPTWLIPFIIVTLLVIVSTYLTFPYIMKAQVERIEQMENIPEARRNDIVEEMEQMRQPPAWQVAIIPVFSLFVLVVFSAVLFFVFNVLMGGDSSFRSVLSVYSYSGLVMIPALIVKLPLIIMKESVNVQTSLALLPFANADNRFLYGVLSGFDIFSLWEVILISLGLGVMYKLSTTKAFMAVLILWVLLILVKSGLSSGLGMNFGF